MCLLFRICEYNSLTYLGRTNQQSWYIPLPETYIVNTTDYSTLKLFKHACVIYMLPGYLASFETTTLPLQVKRISYLKFPSRLCIKHSSGTLFPRSPDGDMVIHTSMLQWQVGSYDKRKLSIICWTTSAPSEFIQNAFTWKKKERRSSSSE